MKFKLDAKVLSGNINATVSSLNTSQSNTVHTERTCPGVKKIRVELSLSSPTRAGFA